jgi:hypothetical protein
MGLARKSDKIRKTTPDSTIHASSQACFLLELRTTSSHSNNASPILQVPNLFSSSAVVIEVLADVYLMRCVASRPPMTGILLEIVNIEQETFTHMSISICS